MDAPKKRLGDILIAAGLLTPEQMSHALDMQKKTGLRLGEILVGQGLVNDADVAQTVAGQLGMPFVSDSELVVQPEFARLISEPVARRLLALPIGEADGRLTVAMADPLNVFALDEIKSITGRDIGPVVVTEKALHRAIQNAYQLTGLADNPALPKVSSEVEVFRLRDLADEAPVVRLVNSIIQRAIEERASDIHLEPLEDRVRVRYRIDGVLQETMSPPKNVHSPVVSRIKIMASMDISERRIPQDGRIQIKDQGRDVDLRVSTLPTIHGEKVVIRVLDKTRGIIKLEQLGFLPQTLARFQSVINLPYGMVLVTGPTGSGKTTTLMATLQEINSPEKNIVTVEDPVEYYLPGVNHVQVNPKAGLDFAGGLRAILRQDPNVIMVGEVRDAETADIAIRAALTGHMVFSTIHTNDASGALTRLTDMGVEPFLIASSVNAVIAQRLARTLCPRCRGPYNLPMEAPERLGLRLPDGPITLYRAGGCSWCNNTGYRGRLALFELLVVTPEIRELVTKKAPASDIYRVAVEQGMLPLARDGAEKAMKGLTTLDEVMRVAYSDER